MTSSSAVAQMQTYRLQMEFHHYQPRSYFSVLSQFTAAHVINNIIIWPGIAQYILTWSRLSVEPTEFAIVLKLSFHRFAILLSPEVPPTLRGRDSFLGLSTLTSFQKSLHSPRLKFWKHWLGTKLILILSQKYHSCQKAVRARHLSSASGPCTSGAPSNIPVAHCHCIM